MITITIIVIIENDEYDVRVNIRTLVNGYVRYASRLDCLLGLVTKYQ